MTTELEQLKKDNALLAAAVVNIYLMVSKQAEDDGLWFRAKTAPEAYLQQELRKLHERIEDHGEAISIAKGLVG